MPHAEWLSLVEISGPFLTVPVLENAFPQGLEAVETPRRQRLRAAYDEWREAVDQKDEMLDELHREWIRLVLNELLEYGEESLVEADKWSGELPSVSSQDRAGVFKPDWIVRSSAQEKPRLFVAVLPPDTDFDLIQRSDDWPLSPRERMTLLCRNHGVRLGVMTDGERWMLVNAPIGSSSSQTSWYARLWFQEPVTLKAFQSLLGARRCFGPTKGTLESLLDESLEHQEEVTNTLGEQVRRAVEVLVQCLDKADADRNRELLLDVKPEELYEAGLTVMMRLVFILCAEERGLLLLGDPTYDSFYAVSTLRSQLEETAELHGPEVLERRHDAWARLLALFRVVYGGIEHENLRMPALGGSLFDPDRFPFLEGRAKGTSWRNTAAVPLPIDNRTVMLLLKSLQILEQFGGGLLLSYRALDVEQIGHVYEGLLEHTVARVQCVTLGLKGSHDAKNPNVALADLESARLTGESDLVELLVTVTRRSDNALKRALSNPIDDSVFSRVVNICGGNNELTERIAPFTNLLRTDAWDDPIVYRDNSFMVTLGADRRETGTHYTPKSLTESIVTTTLEPVVYIGPAEGKTREKWKLKSSRAILDLKICDPAMGSGAFLVQVCRYLAEKLVEAWNNEESTGKVITFDGEVLDELGKKEPMPSQLDERLTIARSLVAERCLYGVDVNPLAVELAKLSIWLVTLSKGRPFGFLDHNLRCGDSLLGIHRLEQLTMLSMDAEPGQQHQLRMFASKIKGAVEEAIELRKRLRATTIRDIKDVEAMAELDREMRQKLESVELIADAMIGEALRCGGNSRNLELALNSLATMINDFLSGNVNMGDQIADIARNDLAIDLPPGKSPRRPFHWALEYPEIFENDRQGFSAIIGNPPYMGGRVISSYTGQSYYRALDSIRNNVPGSPDLSVFFLLRAYSLLSPSGCLGYVTTSAIKDTGNKEVGLDQILKNNGIIFFAIPLMAWPGSSAVLVSQFSIAKGSWFGEVILRDRKVDYISGSLDTLQGSEIFALKSMRNLKSDGYKLMGEGFVLNQQEMLDIRFREENPDEILRPYFGGDDIVELPSLEPNRWAIDFENKTYEEAKRWPVSLERVKQLVKPFRDRQNGQIHQDCFWKFWDMRPKLRQAQSSGIFYLVMPSVSKYIVLRRYRGKAIFNQKTKAIFFSEYGEFAILQSDIHDSWARWRSGSRGITLSYSTSKSLDTFPFPNQIDALDSIGRKYYQTREKILSETSIGPTQFYNDIHNPDKTESYIADFREIIASLTETVLCAYGWTDIITNHDFRTVASLPQHDCIRFTISESARDEILTRLIELNHKRHEEGDKRKLHSNHTLKSASSTKSEMHESSSQYPSLFDVTSDHEPTRKNAAQLILDFLTISNAWHAKETILRESGIPTNQWQSAINMLLADGFVERRGERRSTRYRAVKWRVSNERQTLP